jgi:hypothetical protein
LIFASKVAWSDDGLATHQVFCNIIYGQWECLNKDKAVGYDTLYCVVWRKKLIVLTTCSLAMTEPPPAKIWTEKKSQNQAICQVTDQFIDVIIIYRPTSDLKTQEIPPHCAFKKGSRHKSEREAMTTASAL